MSRRTTKSPDSWGAAFKEEGKAWGKAIKKNVGDFIFGTYGKNKSQKKKRR